jgi:hypothetical protein
MRVLAVVAAAFLCSTAALAQLPLTAQPAAPTPPPPPQTPEQRIAQLKEQIVRLQRELDGLAAAEKAGGLPKQVKAFIAERQLQAIGLPDQNKPAAPEETPAAPPNAPPENTAPTGGSEKRPARLLGDEEKKSIPANVIFIIEGAPATKQEFDAAVTYLQSLPHTETDDQLKEHAMFELVRAKAPQGVFKGTAGAARAKVFEAAKKLKYEGADFAALAKEVSQCPSAKDGGDLGFFDRKKMDFFFTQAAFELPVGDVSGVVESCFGYHIIKVTAVEKGQTADLDRVRASHILEFYAPDQKNRDEVDKRVNEGRLDLAFASDEYRKYAPAAFR